MDPLSQVLGVTGYLKCSQAARNIIRWIKAPWLGSRGCTVHMVLQGGHTGATGGPAKQMCPSPMVGATFALPSGELGPEIIGRR